MISVKRDRQDIDFGAALLVLYSVVAIIYLVLPIADRFGRVLLGSALYSTDAFLNAGILEWGFRRLRLDSGSLFDWTAGFPLSNSLATGENLIGWQILYAPLRMLGASVAGAYNVLMLASLVISGMGAALLAHRLGAGRRGAAVAGFIFAYGPFHLNHMLHIQTMAVCWTPFALLYLDRYLERSSLANASGLVASLVIAALSTAYFAVFLALVLPLYAVLSWTLGRHQFRGRTLAGLAGVGAVALLIVSPLVVPYLRFGTQNGYYRNPPSELAKLSMELLAPLRTPSFQLAWSSTPLVRPLPWSGGKTSAAAFPGIIALVLAVFGVLELKRSPQRRPAVLILVLLVLICYLLALGPILKIFGNEPSRIASWIPMPGRLWLVIPGIRWPMRIFFFAWLAGAIVAGFGVTAILQKFRATRVNAVFAAIILLIFAEYWPAGWLARKSVALPEPLAMSDAYPFLAREADRGAVVELPDSDDRGQRSALAGRYIYGSAGHLRRVVALLGSATPAPVATLSRATHRLPEESARVFLLSHGVTRVVVHRSLMSQSESAKLIGLFQNQGYPLLFNGDEGAVFGLAK